MQFNTRNIRNKHKIYGIFIVSFALFFGFATERMWLSYSRYKAITEVYEIVRIAPTLSHLIQTLQKERGATIGYLSSAKAVFSQRLTRQREKTDQALADFTKAVERDKAQGQSNFFQITDFSPDRFLPNLEAYRERILSGTQGSEEAELYYSSAIRYLLDRVKALNSAGLGSYLSGDIHAYTSLLELEELAGQERAVGVLILTETANIPEIHDRFISLIAKQKAYLNVFMSTASTLAKARVNALANDPNLTALDMARTSISQYLKNTKQPSISVEKWFDLASKRAAVFHVQSDIYSKDIAAQALRKSQRSLRAFWVLVVVAGVLGVSVAVLSIKTARSLIRDQNREKSQNHVLGERYKNLDAVSHLAVFEVDQIGRIHSKNVTAASLLSKAGPPSASFLNLVSAADKEKVSTLIRSAAKGVSSTCEIGVTNPKGSAVYSAYFFPLVSGRSSSFRVMIVAEDITLRLKSEAALLEAVEKAEVSARAKSNFIANMNHELRTPLNHILGFSQILSSHLNDPEQKEWIGYVQTGAQELLGKINAVVELTSRDADVDIKETDLTSFVRETVIKEDWVNSLKSQQKMLVLDVPLSPVTALCDPHEIEQALKHLMDNASKFTGPKDAVIIEVGEANGAAFVSVADSGRGISPKHLGRITEPFEIVDDSFSRTTNGMGLGLAASKRLVERSGGALKISSDIGKGTKVCLCLPAASSKDKPSDPKIQVCYSCSSPTIETATHALS